MLAWNYRVLILFRWTNYNYFKPTVRSFQRERRRKMSLLQFTKHLLVKSIFRCNIFYVLHQFVVILHIVVATDRMPNDLQNFGNILYVHCMNNPRNTSVGSKQGWSLVIQRIKIRSCNSRHVAQAREKRNVAPNGIKFLPTVQIHVTYFYNFIFHTSRSCGIVKINA